MLPIRVQRRRCLRNRTALVELTIAGFIREMTNTMTNRRGTVTHDAAVRCRRARLLMLVPIGDGVPA